MPSMIRIQNIARGRTHTLSSEMLLPGLCLLGRGSSPTQNTNSGESRRTGSQVSHSTITHHSESKGANPLARKLHPVHSCSA